MRDAESSLLLEGVGATEADMLGAVDEWMRRRSGVPKVVEERGVSCREGSAILCGDERSKRAVVEGDGSSDDSKY